MKKHQAGNVRASGRELPQRYPQRSAAQSNGYDVEHAIQRYSDLYEFAPIGYVSFDRSGRIEECNLMAAQLFGMPRERLVGMPFTACVLPEDTPVFLHHLLSCRCSHDRVETELRLKDVRDNVIWTHLSSIPIVGAARNGSALYQTAIIDLTPRYRAEEERMEALRQQSTLYELSQRHHQAKNLEETYQAALRAIIKALQCDRASILLYDSRQMTRFVAWHGLSEKYRHAVEGHSPWKPYTKNPQTICIPDVHAADLPRSLKSTIRAEGIGAAAFVPLVSSGTLIGKFMAYYNAPHAFTDNERQLATTIARQLAQSIQHKRDEEALRHSQQQLARELEDVRLLQQTSAQLIHQDDPREIYEKILDAAVGIMRSEFASIQMFHPKRGETGELHMLAYRGYTPESAAAWEWIGVDHPTTCGMALHTGKRCRVPDVETCNWMAGSKDLAFYRQIGLRSLQSTPLMSRSGKKLGMISTGWKQVHEPSQRDLRLLDVLGRQAADVIERKLSEAAVRQKEVELEEIVTKTPFMLTRCTRDLRYRYVSRAYAEMLGYEPEQLAGKPIVKFIGKKGLQTILPYVEKVLDGDQVDYEMEVPFKGVGPRWLQCTYIPDRDPDGNVVGWFASLIDVGLRKKAEAVLQESKEFLKQQVHERTIELHAVNRSLESEIARRKGLEGEILAVSDREQQRLGQELHDGLCQHLTAVAFMARSMALRLRNHRVIDAADIEKIAQLVNDAAIDTRNLSRALHRADVDAAGLVTALKDLAEREIWRIPCRLEVKPSFQVNDDAVAAHLYRIAREAVINANKHAQARQIIVRLERFRREMVLRVIDDGTGFPKGLKPHRGLGYHIMKYRAQLMGGRLEIDSPRAGGACVSCYFPLQATRSRKSQNGDQPTDVMPKLSRPQPLAI